MLGGLFVGGIFWLEDWWGLAGLLADVFGDVVCVDGAVAFAGVVYVVGGVEEFSDVAWPVVCLQDVIGRGG